MLTCFVVQNLEAPSGTSPWIQSHESDGSWLSQVQATARLRPQWRPLYQRLSQAQRKCPPRQENRL